MDQIVNATVVPLGNAIGWMASSGVLLLVFAGLWVAFGAAIVMNQGSIDATWAWLGNQNILIQAVLWLLFLPVTIGLWIWETSWPMLLRLILVGGLAFWTIMIFLPKAAPKG
jgi:hypothetical protein